MNAAPAAGSEEAGEAGAAGGVRVAYLFTRFPHLTETFLQREVAALRQLGADLDLFSLHGGGGVFEGARVRRFSKWTLLRLLWLLPVEGFRRPAVVAEFARQLFLSWPRDWLNHWENLYGAGIAIVWLGDFRRRRYDHIHAVWATLPATTAWVISRLADIPFSVGAHAYDLFEHGGDWFLRRKCEASAFVHTSTAAGRDRLRALGLDDGHVVLARRGLVAFPPCRPLRPSRRPLRLLCIARLVEKKGLLRQMALYRDLAARGFSFTAAVVGEGPLRPRLEADIRARKLGAHVTLLGALSTERVWRELAAADVLVHTGVVTGSGDRDGLPNVVPEAMAAGVIVVTAPGAGVLEAVEDGRTGLVCPLGDSEAWHRALLRVQSDDALAEALRLGARRWVEENYDAVANARLLLERFRRSAEERRTGVASAPAAASGPVEPSHADAVL